jgi:hypothetical protein
MLIIEYQSNGTTRVVLKKDWHVGRMGTAYVPKQRNYVDGCHMEKLQKALLRKPNKNQPV